MSKVLVIHPKDESTDFLKYVYKDYDYDVITDPNYNRKKLAQQIDLHDKIIMLGHGTSYGLLNPTYYMYHYWGRDREPHYTDIEPYVIDPAFVELLKKKETVSIWCNSDQFFRPRKMKGLHTGMIISEVDEQKFVLGKVYLDKKQQLYNMLNFARIVGQCIEKSPEEMQNYIWEYYDYDDPVTQYNRNNIIVI